MPSARLVEHVLGLPDTLHPNTYASIATLAESTFVAAVAGTAAGVVLRAAWLRSG